MEKTGLPLIVWIGLLLLMLGICLVIVDVYLLLDESISTVCLFVPCVPGAIGLALIIVGRLTRKNQQ